tara:strand:- start:1357 stop:1896 length:540 start_codon:yes stop_codon:yes gene_type:complete
MFELRKNFIKSNEINNLLNEISFSRDNIIINNLKIPETRLTYWMSDYKKFYKYGGKIMSPNNMTESVKKIQEKIKKEIGVYFDSVLINYYQNGSIGMKYHSDETYNEWEEESVVISFGDERKIIFREITNKESKCTLLFENGDLLLMKNGCQSTYQHRVCKSKTEKKRISLVFKKSKLI